MLSDLEQLMKSNYLVVLIDGSVLGTLVLSDPIATFGNYWRCYGAEG